MRKVVSCSTDSNPVYAFFAPLTALMWREVCCWDTLMALIGNVDKRVEDKCLEVGATVYHAQPIKSTSATAQLIRLYAYLHPTIAPDDYVGMVDVDAWPLNPVPFEPSGKEIDLLCPYWACGNGVNFPMGWSGAKANTWRKLLGYDYGCPESGVACLYASDPGIAERARFEDPGFNYDEHLLTNRLEAYPGFPDCADIRKRKGQLLEDRLERSAWPKFPDCHAMTDAHLPRPAYTDENWEKVRPLLQQRLSPKWLAWADDYRREWAK